FDAMLAQSEDEWAAVLDQYKPRYAILFEDNFNYLSKMCLLRMRQAAFTMANMASQRGVTAIICGADATDHTSQYLAHGFSYVIRGEGEETLRELMASLTGKSDAKPENINGLSFIGDSGDVQQTMPRPALRDLDSLPFPAWDLVDRER